MVRNEEENKEEEVDWPAHRRKVVAWSQQLRGGTREDRTLNEVEVNLPPHIVKSDFTVRSTVSAEMENALRAIVRLDAENPDSLGALGTMLLRTECVASSRIEEIDAGIDDYARALHGVNSNPSATSMVRATSATDVLLSAVTRSRMIGLDDLMTAHRTLMSDDPTELDYAGRARDVQNWIGGSQYSPRDALYVPPPPDTVDGYLNDLIAYTNRDDVPVLVQAAIGHAQFESIHPFTDGNGRIGRALINGVLRRRRVTNTVVVPLASALVAHRDRYFDDLGAYRDGDPTPLIRSFVNGSQVAASESRTTARHLREIPDQWRDMTGPVRRNSAAAAILDSLIATPILTADDVEDRLGLRTSSVYEAIDRLRSADVIRPLTDRKRNQIWGAGLVLDELDALGARIKRAAT